MKFFQARMISRSGIIEVLLLGSILFPTESFVIWTFHHYLEIKSHCKLSHSFPKKIPEIIYHCNKTKYGVDIVDQMIQEYTCSTITRQWPLWLFINILDTAAFNVHVIRTYMHSNWMKIRKNTSRMFQQLMSALVRPHV
ncbi:hypothetical protein T06_10086 [Trichinella sp. T6]|nr:hypothetical protein T06_10086 [Trichinella sp. T6]